MKKLFSAQSPYKKTARSIAIAWTLLIFIGCLMPAREIPHVDVPLIDKWTHFVMFGMFSFLWLLAVNGASSVKVQLIVLLTALFTGCLIEYMQGTFTSLGRSMELMDAVADAIGGLLGVVLYRMGAAFSRR